MITLTVLGKEYKIEFRHLTREGKRAKLSKKCPIKAVTTAVIVGDGFIAMDTAVCFNTDNFSREYGRCRALWKALRHVPLAPVREVFMNTYVNSRPREAAVLASSDPTSPGPPSRKMRAEQRHKLIEAGESVRAARAVKRSASA